MAANLNVKEIRRQRLHKFVMQHEQTEVFPSFPCRKKPNECSPDDNSPLANLPSLNVNLFDFMVTLSTAGPSPQWFSKRVIFGGDRIPP